MSGTSGEKNSMRKISGEVEKPKILSGNNKWMDLAVKGTELCSGGGGWWIKLFKSE